MTKIGYVNCPEHGIQQVSVNVNTHTEYAEKYTAKCPQCGKRLVVKFN